MDMGNIRYKNTTIFIQLFKSTFDTPLYTSKVQIIYLTH